ncbi:MAG: ABC transporter permease [Cytophagales bacterium]|nr:ABC transporter permease [Cytophagales bacterium]
MKHTPPKWADKFLTWYCRADLLEEIQGDAYELYERTAKKSKRKADLLFIWNVLRFFRLRNMQRKTPVFASSYITLVNSYLLAGIRNANRHRLNSTINVIGLAVAIGIVLTSALFIENQFNSFSYQKNADRVFQITSLVKTGDELQEWGDTPSLLGSTLREAETSIVGMTRVHSDMVSARFKNGDAFYEQVSLVDPEFAQLFTLALVSGDLAQIKSKNTVALNQQQAEKYFGDQNPIGQTLSLKFGSGMKDEFIVIAVFNEPINSSIYFGLIISFLHLQTAEAPAWQKNTTATFILLGDQYAASDLTLSLAKYKDMQNLSSPNWKVDQFNLRPLTELATNSKQINNSISHGAHPAGLIALGVISILLLVVSCLNYVNVAISTVSVRLREIAIRKVIGGSKREIVQQFLTENLVICTLATVAGVLLAYAFFLPAFRNLTPIEVPFQFSSWMSGVVFFFGLIVFVGIVSGLYPALYVAAFAPAQILKGKQQFGHHSLLSKGLLTLQFILAITTVVSSFIFVQNALNLKNRDWGYVHQDVIALFATTPAQYAYLNHKLQANTKIKSLAGTTDHVGMDYNWRTITAQHTNYDAMHYRTGFNYLETINTKLIVGRYFDSQIESDKIESAIVTQSFADLLSWDAPLNQTFVADSNKYVVVGVVQDFLHDAYHSSAPAFFTITPKETFNYICASVKTGSSEATIQDAKNDWNAITPDDPFEGFQQEEVFRGFNEDLSINTQLLIFVACVAVLLSGLGLYGLVSFNITRRLKEFSIRKIFGANMIHIFRLMSKEYVRIAVVSFLIGCPAGYLLINMFINEIYVAVPFSGLAPFFYTLIVLIAIVTSTVGIQMKRITQENPTETLKIE